MNGMVVGNEKASNEILEKIAHEIGSPPWNISIFSVMMKIVAIYDLILEQYINRKTNTQKVSSLHILNILLGILICSVILLF